jgi:GH15 family glucan-1,4-alpha-glucosidase
MSRIEDYALIGDCETAALVDQAGSIDWLCWPRFDSPACFAALLGTAANGRWLIQPVAMVKRCTRRYREGTLILETTWETEHGTATVVDFMAIAGKDTEVVRLVRGDRGVVAMHLELVLRFDYGQSIPWVTQPVPGTLRAIAGPNMAVLRTVVPLHGEDLKTLADFTVHASEVLAFVLTYVPSHLPMPTPTIATEAFQRTEEFWRDWVRRSTYRGPWGEAVERSLLTLKALTYRPTGGIVAAPTTSLPEQLGGPRNWDYRFCWLRDATFTLRALLNAGYVKEATDWQNWLVRAVAGSPAQVQNMYGLAGERQVPELEIDWLPGYKASRPVRIGNAASEQLQLDIYGEIIGVLHHARRHHLRLDEPVHDLQEALLAHLEAIWREPDQGMWEVRGPRQQFTHSKVMAWVAFDRAIKNAQEFGFDGPVDRWRVIRQQIHHEVCREAFDQEQNSFVQAYGSKQLDASLLIMGLVGFLPPSDARLRGTVQAVERHLMHRGFVKRYLTEHVDDGVPPGEGAFLPCSFWLVSNYALLGQHDRAGELLERLVAVRNDVGLLGEEYDPDHHRMLGNFPQALSHVALVNAAMRLQAGNAEPSSSAPAPTRGPEASLR